MARRGASHIILGELASATNRSEGEVRLALGLGAAAAGLTIVLRTVWWLVDLNPR